MKRRSESFFCASFLCVCFLFERDCYQVISNWQNQLLNSYVVPQETICSSIQINSDTVTFLLLIALN